MALLSPRVLGRLERVQLHTRQRTVGGLVGEHRSRRYGSSLDFSDYREYYPGDDLRRLDLNALARLDRLLLKLYEAEDDLHVRLLVDLSASMEGAKLQRAKELAAALGFVALTNRDIVTVHGFPSAGLPSGASGQRLLGRAAVPQLFHRIESMASAGETPFASAAVDLLSRPGTAGMTFVISDLLTPEWQQGLRKLPARRGDLAVIHVLDEADITPPVGGDVQLVDAESGATVDVSITPAAAAEYQELVNAWIGDVGRQVRSLDASYVLSMADDDLEATLFGSTDASSLADEGTLR